MTFDRRSYVKTWRETNPLRVWLQRQREYARRRALRAAGRQGRDGRCLCKAQGNDPHLEFCPRSSERLIQVQE